jgi:hypothetical protein
LTISVSSVAFLEVVLFGLLENLQEGMQEVAKENG